MIPEWSLVLAVDFHHLRELAMVSQTWAKNRPLIFKRPWVVFADDTESHLWWQRKLAIATGRSSAETKVVMWPRQIGGTQRGRMLSAFTWGVAEFCETPWHLKLDTDTVAMEDVSPWPNPEWFEGSPVFIGRKWGYTKPRQMFRDLIAWAKTQPVFDDAPEAPGDFHATKDRVGHPRIISHSMFGSTEFAKEVAALDDAPGPIPSHDTLWWYVAHRLGRPYLRLRDAQGFAHGRKLASRCDRAMGRVADD